MPDCSSGADHPRPRHRGFERQRNVIWINLELRLPSQIQRTTRATSNFRSLHEFSTAAEHQITSIATYETPRCSLACAVLARLSLFDLSTVTPREAANTRSFQRIRTPSREGVLPLERGCAPPRSAQCPARRGDPIVHPHTWEFRVVGSQLLRAPIFRRCPAESQDARTRHGPAHTRVHAGFHLRRTTPTANPCHSESERSEESGSGTPKAPRAGAATCSVAVATSG
jgi:hypothetical protein